jgi:hypothetical protein
MLRSATQSSTVCLVFKFSQDEEQQENRLTRSSPFLSATSTQKGPAEGDVPWIISLHF